MDKEFVEQTAQQTQTTPQKSQQQNRPIPPSLNNGTKQNGPPGLPGSSTTEDLTDSWKTTFAVPAQENLGPKPADCPDNDGDGFVDATICGDWIDISEETAMMPMHR